jgi:hypothetical protein
VAHEVRNPLGVIRAAVGLLERSHGAQPATEEIRAQVERASRFADELLEYGRPAPLSLRPVDLLAIAEQEKVKLDPAAAEVIARAAEGGMRDAESMLDQVVSFCGDKVNEQDVLSIFGFASVDDVAALAGHILSGDAAAALDLVAAQSAAGKDLGRLLSDLVAMSRDLLVSDVIHMMERHFDGAELGGVVAEIDKLFSGRFDALVNSKRLDRPPRGPGGNPGHGGPRKPRHLH